MHRRDDEGRADGMNCWGKASPSGWHPLPHHSFDVAATGLALLHRMPALRQRLGRPVGLNDPQVERWVAFWLSLHDLGKFAESFQSQRADLFATLRGREPNPAKPYVLRHDSLGMLFWVDVVQPLMLDEAWFGPGSEDLALGLDAWMRASTGHHGQPPRPGGFWRQHFDATHDKAAALAHVQSMRTMFLTEDLVATISSQDVHGFLVASQELSWWMAGLAILADWLGSNTDYFPYTEPDARVITPAEYWRCAKQRAAQVVAASGVLAPASAASMRFGELFPGLRSPSPLQHWATEVTLGPGPQLHCLEDVTGAGKTEAALMLVHRLMAAGAASGLFVALPTMATANAMYARLATAYQRLFEAPASLVLATSGRNLVDAFAATVVEDLGAGVLPPDTPEADRSQADETASARCAAWLADHHKRALLSPAGVGTIDQALLAVLHSKHQSLRLLGLMHKVLVVDEVHACDDYMLRVLSVLLEFHARGGGSAVLLSATLPQRGRQTLLAAFARGLRRRAPQAPSAAYPLATSWPSVEGDGALAQQTAIDTRADVRRCVTVQLHDQRERVLSLIRTTLAAGQCLCWVRNTVADALEAFSQLQAELPADRLWLFHARFALHDRLAMEQQVLQAFGKASGPSQRAGRVLIATQVVEQSLDLDFDVLLSDLAPVDRLVQRAGRLRRHRRRADGSPQADAGAVDERGEPVMHVLCPAWSDNPGPDWYRAAFPRAARVYPHHAQSWLTMQALRQGQFTMPDDARRLVEGVFGDRADVPPGLQANALAAEGEGFAAQSQAMTNTLSLALGYTRAQTGGVDWWSDAHTPSRLGEATTTVTLARWDGCALRPWVERPHGWAYSSLRLAERSIAGAVESDDPALRSAVEAVKEQLPAQGRWSVLLPLRQTADGWVGEALAAPAPGRPPRTTHWRYDPARGLEAWRSDGDTPDDEPQEGKA
jgi:CRISPR-associated endonuclease/helicase Cas3